MRHFFCSTCDNPLKIKEGDFLFTYNIECYNNHISKNIDLEDILSTEKEQIYICQNHKKKNIIHCLDCKVDICLTCFKELHNKHKMGYLNENNLIMTDCLKLNHCFTLLKIVDYQYEI